jgi:hypothetical protein
MPDLQVFNPFVTSRTYICPTGQERVKQAVREDDMNLECQVEVTVTVTERCMKLLTTFLWQPKYLLATNFNPILHHPCKWLDRAPGRTCTIN